MEPARKRGALAGGLEPRPVGPDDLVTGMVDQLTLEFESRSPEIADFQQLLQQLFLKAPVNLTDMTSLLIHQPKMGSVIIKQVSDDDDDDINYFTEKPMDDDYDNDANQVFGITSVINITEKTSECVKKLHTLMLDLSNKHSDSDTTQFCQPIVE